jgi:hypothetical protein
MSGRNAFPATIDKNASFWRFFGFLKIFRLVIRKPARPNLPYKIIAPLTFWRRISAKYNR